MAELIEAAARTGQAGRAAGTMRFLSHLTLAAGTDWALGVRARSLALLSDREDLYQAALEYLGRSRARVDLARAHLLYGEWLRRENRRADAREQLHRPHGMLTEIGAEGFTERARRELLATGGIVRGRTLGTDRKLTPQEVQIAVRARDGKTNSEIGAELFLSPRTVEWHLRKVFAKLGITSRRQLRHVLPGARRASRLRQGHGSTGSSSRSGPFPPPSRTASRPAQRLDLAPAGSRPSVATIRTIPFFGPTGIDGNRMGKWNRRRVGSAGHRAR